MRKGKHLNEKKLKHKNRISINNIFGILFKMNYWMLFMYLFIIISSISYFLGFFKIQDIKNSFLIHQLKFVFYGQIVLYILLIILFIYFSRKVILKQIWQKKDYFFLAAAFICILLIHISAFNPALDTNGDNAAYIIFAKAFVQEGGFYSIYRPGTELTYNAQTAIGLPLLLIPIYTIFGINIVKMKILILLLTLISIGLVFIIFKKFLGKPVAAILAIIFAIHPFTVSYSSMIMTEIPYIFWSLLAMLLIMKYEEKEKISITLLIFSTISIFMLYLTRAIGAGLAIGVMVYFMIKYDFIIKVFKRDFSFIKTMQFKKFIILLIFTFSVFLLYQIYNISSSDSSQGTLLLNKLSWEKVSQSLKDLYNVLPQNIFAADIVRWKIAKMDIKWILLLIIIVVGTIRSMIKKELFGYYFIFSLSLLIIANPSYSPIVFSRYLVIFTPILLYFLYFGLQTISLIFKSKNLTSLLYIIVFFLITLNSFSGDALFIQRAHTGTLYSPPFDNYIKAAQWAKDNLPKDSIIACRKERIFYLFSGFPGFKHTTYHDGNTPEHNKKREKLFEKYDADYIILDSFNSSTINNVLPWVQENSNAFSLVHVVGKKETGPTYILKINKWWI